MKYLFYVNGIKIISKTGYNYNRMNEKSTTSNCHYDMYEQCDRQLEYITDILVNMNVINNIHIKRALINFRWLMLTSIIINSIKLIIKRQLSIRGILDDTSSWVLKYNSIMKENIDDERYLATEYITIYKYRLNLNKYNIVIHYLISKTYKYINKKIF